MIEVVTGDRLRETLYIRYDDGSPVEIQAGAVVKVQFVHSKQGASGTVRTLDIAAAGTDLAAGTLILDLPPEETRTWPIGRGYMEVEVNDPSPLTYFVENLLVRQDAIQ